MVLARLSCSYGCDAVVWLCSIKKACILIAYEKSIYQISVLQLSGLDQHVLEKCIMSNVEQSAQRSLWVG